MKSYDKDVLFETTSMEKYLYIRVHNILFIFALRSKTGKAKEWVLENGMFTLGHRPYHRPFFLRVSNFWWFKTQTWHSRPSIRQHLQNCIWYCETRNLCKYHCVVSTKWEFWQKKIHKSHAHKTDGFRYPPCTPRKKMQCLLTKAIPCHSYERFPNQERNLAARR